jgi:hypothetical protein
MRVNFFGLDLTEGNWYYRFKDVLEHRGSAIQGPEALEDDYYEWVKEKDFAWCENGDYRYIIAFYENHPFFNCMSLRYVDMSLRYVNMLLDDVGGDMACLPASAVVEPWFRTKVYPNYKRRQKRKKL